MFQRIRRQLVALLISACTAPAFAAEPIRLVVPFPAGGPLDVTGRLLADKLKSLLGTDVIVDNKGGANGNLGGSLVANAAADGNTLLMASDGIITVNPYLYPAAALKPNDLKPIGMVATVPQMLVVPASSGIKSLAEFTSVGKQRELTYASGGVGSGGHLALAYLSNLMGLKTLHVPFQGAAPAMTALLGQQVESAFLTLPSALPHVKSGKLRALAVSTAARLPELPDVPTVAELGYKDFVIVQSYLLMAPAKLDDAKMRTLSDKLAQIVKDNSLRQALVERGMQATWMGPAESARWLTSESQRWAKVIEVNRIEAR